MGTYSKEFRDQIVICTAERGRTLMELSREFNISATSISNWMPAAEQREVREVAAAGGEAEKDRIARLEKGARPQERGTGDLGKAPDLLARKADQ